MSNENQYVEVDEGMILVSSPSRDAFTVEEARRLLVELEAAIAGLE